MPTNFNWTVQYTIGGKSAECSGRNSCRESAANAFADFFANNFSVNLHEVCKEDQLKVIARTSTYKHKVGDVIAFLQRWYPVKCSLVDLETFDGIKRMLQIEGNHLVINAWWWATLYCRLIHSGDPSKSEDPTERFLEMVVWYDGGYEYHSKALRDLLEGEEKPLYLDNFYSGPVDIAYWGQ